MKVRLRVMVAVAAAAALGVMGAVAAVPALATGPAHICSTDAGVGGSSQCVVALGSGDPVVLLGPGNSPTNWETGSNCETGTNGQSYCQIKQDGPNLCLQWDEDWPNVVIEATCDSNTISQHWWWSGQRFRNLYATQIGRNGVCLAATGDISLDLCSNADTAWSW